uniref:Nucleoporin 50 n=1 Tax=Kryptolebias marmoratus TaxID=37003 RepID=A0A3Q3B614_KRYMA
MAKRIADKELTDRNWDQEDEGEEAGTFLVASDDVLKSRAIKKAKRRNTGAESEGSGAFRGFKGFASSAAAASPAPFSGFGNAGGFKGFGGLTNGTGSAPAFGGFSSPAASAAAAGLTFNGPSSTPPTADSGPQQTNGSAPSPPQSHREYRRQLTALNCSVRDWITKHVNDNPLCDLNPIFRDYERHLASIERQYGASEEKKPPAAAAPPSSSSSSSSPAAPSAALFSFSKNTSEDSAQKSSGGGGGAAVTFNFGQKVDSSVLGSLGSKPASLSFSSSSSKTSLFGGPGSTTPLSFSGTKTEEAQPAGQQNLS